MAVTARIAELERRHQMMEREIETTLAHPSSDPLKLVELKRKKLRIKESIEKLKGGASLH